MKEKQKIKYLLHFFFFEIWQFTHAKILFCATRLEKEKKGQGYSVKSVIIREDEELMLLGSREASMTEACMLTHIFLNIWKSISASFSEFHLYFQSSTHFQAGKILDFLIVINKSTPHCYCWINPLFMTLFKLYSWL